MATRAIDAWNEHGWTISVQHPAVRLTLTRWSPTTRLVLPVGEGCYCLANLTLQTSYVGEATSLRSRVPSSIRANLPMTSHLLLVEPLGFPWGDERTTLEALLIAAVPGVVNRSPGKSVVRHSVYLEAVALEVVTALAPLLFATGNTGWAVPSQGRGPRDLVLQEHQHPRRDCLDRGRGGSSSIRVTGPWTDPGTHVFVDGRRYASGWAPGPLPQDAVTPE